MHVYQLQRFSSANIGNHNSKIPLYVNYRQVIPQGLWDSHLMKSNGKHVLLSLKICSIRFASLRKAEQSKENLRSIAFMDFLWNNLVVISERIKQKTVCFGGEKKDRVQ